MRLGPARIARGLLNDAAPTMEFRFDGRALRGLAGDTLAAALLANGVRLVGRSFKYHRPRGIVTAGPHEPCALVDVLGDRGREPNRLATTLVLQPGLIAESQNRWPSLRFDARALSDLFARFLPAGFYYKTFMAPRWAWERGYEPLIRRAAGLGRLEPRVPARADPAETVHDHADVLVIGAGAAGLAAAQQLGAGGLRVILAEQDVVAGGGTLLDARWDTWREALVAQLARLPGVRCLIRTTILGAYGHGVFGALETLSAADSARCGGLRERLRVMRVRRVLIASGALERPIAFPGNDVPGVMLAGAGLAYLRRYGVAVGARPAFFLNNDEAYEAVTALTAAGVACAGVIDVRGDSRAAARARAQGIEVHAGAVVAGVRGRKAVHGVRIRRADGRIRELEADSLLVSGGYTPLISLATQLGVPSLWQESLAAFIPAHAPPGGAVAGAARGVSGLAAAARDGAAVACELAAQLGRTLTDPAARAALPPDSELTPLEPLWEVAGTGKAFVDLQNDVTASDVRLACREGYEHLEHMKRFTTHGMAGDQGRIGGLLGSAVLAEARGVSVAEVGQLKPRPFAEPVPFAALAGGEVREHYRPKRRLPLHDWHESAGATFVSTGLWLRPLVYAPRRPGWEAVLEEARAVRQRVGLTDVSSLGKIEVHGPDASQFLDFVYASSFSRLPPGRVRYGIMLREDGMVFDDGTTSHLAPGHFLITTTTANAQAVLEHLEFHRQSSCARLDLVLADISDQWAQFAVAGPRAREVVAKLVELDLSNAAFPFMATASVKLAGIAARLFRISFSGELAYEVAVPAAHALTVWSALLEAGAGCGIRPYGLDALNTLRIEKGHVTAAELNGNTSADDLGLARMLKTQGDFLGRTLAQRAALQLPERLQLVGVRPIDRTQRLRNGQQLVAPEAPAHSLGYVTSSTPSVELPGWVGLALLAGGRGRIGARLIAASPVHGERIAVEIVSPCMVDPENRRVRA